MENNSKSGKWKWWGWVIALVMVMIVAGLVVIVGVSAGWLPAEWMPERDRQPERLRVAISPELTLEEMAVVTAANPKYEEGKNLGVRWLYGMLPTAARRRFPSLRPGNPDISVNFGGLDATDAKLLMRVDYPREWLDTRTKDQVRQKIDGILEKEGIQALRVGYGPGAYLPVSYISKDFYSYGSSGSTGRDYKPFVTLDLEKLPVNVEMLRLDFVDTSDWNKPRVITGWDMRNPLYRPVKPLDAPPAALPATVADKDIEVTLRALVTRTDDGNIRQEPTGGKYQPVLVKGKPLPEEGPMGPEFFAKGNEAKGYSSRLVAKVTRNGRPQTEWGWKDLEIAYGKELLPFGVSRWSSVGFEPGKVVTFPGDLSLLPGPLMVSIRLQREDNFPPDEKQTVEVTLPKEGEGVEPNVPVKLWDQNVVIKAVSYRKEMSPFGRTMNHIKSRPDTLAVFLTGSMMSVVKDVKLVGEGGTSVSLSNRQSSANSSDKATVVNYDLRRNVSYGGRNENINYGDYTTLSLTLVSPRTRDFPFDFVVTPEVATGSAGDAEE